MNIATPIRRIILAAGLALAALAPAALGGPAADAQAPTTLSPLRVLALGTEATVSFTSSEPVAVTITHTPTAGGRPVVRSWDIYTTTHATTLTGLTSNTQYQVSVTAVTPDGRRTNGSANFYTAKKRVRVTLREINVTEDGDIFWMNGEPTWYTRLEWAGGFSGGCFPIDCQQGSYSEGRIQPRNPAGQPLMWLLAEENFDAMPTKVTLYAGAYENDASFVSRIAQAIEHFVSCVGSDCLGSFAPDDLDFAAQVWQVPAGQDFASTTVVIQTDHSGQGFKSTMAFTFELFHDNLNYPAARNTAQSTWHR
jgi:hypothetical protein